MVNKSMRYANSAAPSAAVHAAAGDALLSLAADVPSAVVSSSPATLNVAGARDESPRECDSSLEVDYECESDEMADSGRTEQSPDHRLAADYEPSNEGDHSRRRAGSIRYSMFGSDDEDDYSSPALSPVPSPAPVSVQGDDGGVSYREKVHVVPLPLRGVKTVKCLISPLKRSRGFCQKVSSIACLEKLLLTINIPYLLRQSYMALIPARRIFALRKNSISMLF